MLSRYFAAAVLSLGTLALSTAWADVGAPIVLSLSELLP